MTSFLHADPAELLTARLHEIQHNYDVVGLSAVAVRSGEVVWHAELGMADIERGVPVTEETKYRIASISKLAAAAALMQFWEQGKFDLDDDISDTLGFPVVNPGYPESPITFRHLLTHTSSLRAAPTTTPS